MLKINKVLKKILIISFSVIMAVFLILLITPLLFKNQLMELAKNELNKIMLAKVDFRDLNLSFIRSFPNAYVGLEGLEIKGIGDFEDELLISFDRFSVTVDIMSVIRMKNIEVKSILLENARLNGHILDDGRANWNIVRPGEEKDEAVKTDSGESDPFVFNVGLRRFEIRNMRISFRDDKNNMSAEVRNLNYILRGDMTKENVDLNMELGIDGIDFLMGGIRFVNNASAGFVSQVAADLKNLNFILKENRFNLNDIVLKLDGSVDINGSGIYTDVTFATERTDFKSLLSLVPAVYMNDFQDVRTTGNLALDGNIKGTLGENTMPSANVNLLVNDAAFSYPALPKSVDNINIAMKAYYDGEELDRSTLDLDRLSFHMAGNPFTAQLHVKTPESDMQVSAKFAGRIDFDSVSEIIPFDDITLNGLLECDISLAGRLSMLENERYEDFQAEGHLRISGFDFASPDFPQRVTINTMLFNFSPRRAELANFEAIVGSTDVALNGSLENFIPFIFKGDTVRGTLAIRSNKIDLNEFMGGGSKEKPEEETPQGQLRVIEVPKNIDFALAVNIGQILFDKLSITNTAGAVMVRDGRLLMQNLAMNLLEGNLTLNGEYNTQNLAVPFADLNLNINQFDIPAALSSFSMLEKILPQPQNYAGRVSAAMTFSSVLGANMAPVTNQINSTGRLQTYNLEIRNSGLFGMMADLFHNERLRTPAPGNLDIRFEIRDGRLFIEDPIAFNLEPVRIEIRGSQGLDTTMDYRVQGFVPVSVIGSGATDVLSRIPGGSRITEVSLTGRIQGSAARPDISLGVADMAGSVVEAVRDQVAETVTQRVEEVRTQVSEEVNRQIAQVMAEAERQAENIRSGAKQAADRVRGEANSAAERLISNAGSNIIQRRLAEGAAETLRNEGETNARRLEQEGETQAQAALAAAQRTADNLRRN